MATKRDFRRAIRALCFDCRAGARFDCRSRACPLYPFLHERELEPAAWWEAHPGDWRDVSQAFRKALQEGKELPVVPQRESVPMSEEARSAARERLAVGRARGKTGVAGVKVRIVVRGDDDAS